MSIGKWIMLCLLWCFSWAHAAMELGGNFSYNKQVLGDHRDQILLSREYSAYWAIYFFGYTGLEFNYSYHYDLLTDNGRTDLGSGITVTSSTHTTKTTSYGIGLRQALAGNTSFVVPVISVGYAKQFTHDYKDYQVDYQGTPESYHYDMQDTKTDSVYGTFSLKFQVFQRFSLTGSVRTVFKAWEWNEAKYNIAYMAGFSLMF